MSELTLTQTEVAKIFNRSIQQIANDIRNGRLDTDEKSVIKNDKYINRKSYYKILDENKE